METVKAEQQPITYQCECPECGATIYSDLHDDWDIHEMVHYNQEIECTDCPTTFRVSL